MTIDWDQAMCRRMSKKVVSRLFFFGPSTPYAKPAPSVQEVWDRAKEVCLSCPLLGPCEAGSKGEEFGVWGGRDQYERYLYRRKVSRRLAKMTEEEKDVIAAELHGMTTGPLGRRPVDISRRTGYAVTTVKKLLDRHDKVTKAVVPAGPGRLTPDEERALLSMAKAGASVQRMASTLGRGRETIAKGLVRLDLYTPAPPEFPSAPPPGHAWVWHNGIARSAHYIGQTADGAHLFMSLRVNKWPAQIWLPADHVQLRIITEPVVLEWKGRKDAPEAETARTA